MLLSGVDAPFFNEEYIVIKKAKKVKKARPAGPLTPDKVLASWRDLLQALPYMTLDELAAALKEEMDKPAIDQRLDIVFRIKRRMMSVEMKIERERARKALAKIRDKQEAAREQ